MQMKISIIGPMASGKTTLGQMLAEKLACNFLAEPLEHCKLIEHAYAGKLFAKSNLHLQMLFCLLFEQEAVMQHASFVQDGNALANALLYGKLHLCKKQFKQSIAILQNICQLTQYDYIFMLTISPESLMRRISQRGRQMEINVSQSYVEALCKRASEINRIGKTCIHKLDAECSPEMLCQQIIIQLEGDRIWADF